jgi:hypothetical protein
LKRFIKILLKTILTIAIILVVGLILLFYAMQLPQVQTYTLQKVTEELSKKLGSPVKIGKARITWLDEITLEDVVIYDYKQREMINVKELYVNCKTNFTFDIKNIINFDNNLDFVMIRNPKVHLIRESDGDLNIDKWIAKIEKITASSDTLKPKPKGEHNIPFTIDEAYIQDGIFTLEDPEEKRFPKEEFDYNTFTLHEVNGKLNKFFIQGDTITFDLKDMKAFDRRSKLDVKNLETKFFYSRQQLRLNELYAKINNSTIKDYLGFFYDTPRDFGDFNEKVVMKSNFNNCEIDAQDLARFAPDMYQYQANYLLNGKFDGTVHDFKVKDFKLNFGNNSYLDGDIAFKGMPEYKTAKMDLLVRLSRIDTPDTRQYVGDSLYLNYVQKFGTVTFGGTFNGVYDNFTTDSFVQTALGNASGNITMKIADDPTQSTYFGNLTADNLDLATITGEKDLLQKMSFSGKIDGKGMSIQSASLGFDGKVKHIWFNGYDYKNIYLDGEMSQSIFDGRVSVKDTNLTFDVMGKVDFSKELNAFDIKGFVQNANLRPLGYAKNDVKLTSQINLNFRGNELDNWLGEAQFLHTILQYDKRKLGVDSLFLTSSLSGDLRDIKLNSEFFNVDISGKFTPSTVISDLTRLSKEYTQYFLENEQNRLEYYAIRPEFTPAEKYALDYQVTFKKSQPFFDYFYPDLVVSNGTQLGGTLNIRNTAELTLTGKIDTLRHGDLAFFNNDLDFITSKEYNSPKILTSLIFNSEKQKLSNMAPTEKLSAEGSWGQGNVINFDGRLKQQNSSNKAQVFGKLTFLSEGLDLTFNPRNTKLDLLGNTWVLARNNLINIDKDDICFQDVALSNQNQSLALNGTFSADSSKESYIDVHDFDLQTLQPLSDLDLKGIVNGKLTLRDVYKNTVVTSALNIDELVYRDILVGTVTSEVLWDNIVQKLNINGNIVRINNEIFRINGTYDPKDQVNPLNLKATLRKTNIEIFESFVDDIFSNLGGYATGTLTVRGTATDPIIRGEVDFDKGMLRVNALNSYLYFDDKIRFSEEGFVTEEGFKVRDNYVNGNVAKLRGGIYNGGGGNFMVGIYATMDDRNGFKIMNTTSNDNESFYGVGVASGRLDIRGTFDDIVIKGDLTSKKGTKITIPLDNETSVDTEDQSIQFVKKNTDNQLVTTPKDSLQDNSSSKLSMSFNFTITPDAECEVIFDRNTKDKLNAFGSGNISIDYDSDGGFTMSGPYTIKSGKYDYSLQNISKLRKFEIAEGSWIRWTGDPYDADIDIKANFTANISLDPSAINNLPAKALNNRYPVIVGVNMSDKLMKPKINLGLRFNQRSIPIELQPPILAFEQRLKDDEQLMNNHVSSVLILNRLYPENSLADALNTQFVIDNVSNMLTNQVSDMISEINPNLQIGVQIGDLRQNLNNMNINFSYQFGNRLRLSGNSTYFNNSLTNNNSQLSVGGEAEYLITEDGTWRARVYSKSVPSWQYSYGLNSGETFFVNGLTLQYSRNFNTLIKRKSTTQTPIGVKIPDVASSKEILKP